MQTIGKNIFANCENIKEIRYYGTKEEWSKIQKDKNWNSNKHLTINCTDGEIIL